MSSSAIKVLPRSIPSSANGTKALIFENVQFPKHKAKFRLSMLPLNDEANSTRLWLEDRSSKHQWELIVNEKEIDEKCKLGGIPAAAILDFLASVIAELDEETDQEDSKSATTTTVHANLIEKKGELSLELTVELSRKWKPKFEFSLHALQLDPVDVLESKLRDTNDRLAAVEGGSKNARKPVEITAWGKLNTLWNTGYSCTFELEDPTDVDEHGKMEGSGSSINTQMKNLKKNRAERRSRILENAEEAEKHVKMEGSGSEIKILKKGRVLLQAHMGSLAFTAGYNSHYVTFTNPGQAQVNFFFVGDLTRELQVEADCSLSMIHSGPYGFTPTTPDMRPCIKLTFLN